MRLHQLEVEAFGPFARPCLLDLDEVSSGGLFLVHGPTGSGKTSLIDAICFALFADVPGARSKKGLRSDHAQDGAVPRVRLEFTAGGRRLRITRSPEYSRPKKRGQGLLKVPAQVVLHEFEGGSWLARSTRHDEVADLIDQVLGLGLAQFATVAVLPQGEFATFLRATPEDRRAVLERLFDISTFRQVEDWLVEERRRSAALAAGLIEQVRTQVVRLHDALATAPGATTADDEPGGSTEGELPTAESLDHLRLALDQEVTTTMAAYDDATGSDRTAREALAAARLISAARERGERAAAQRHSLDTDLPAQQARIARLAAARRAEIVTGHRRAVAAADADVQLAHLDVARLGQLLEHLPTTADVEISHLLEELLAGDDVVAELRLAADGAGLSLVTSRSVAEALDQAEQVAALAQADADAAAAELESAEAVDATAAAVVADIPTLQSAVEIATRRLSLRRAVEEDGLRDLELREQVVTAAENAVRAQTHVLDLRRQRFEGMAAELATSLVDGEPCMVCGSPEHPAPAHADRLVTADDITRAEQHAVRAETLRTALELERQAATVRITERRSQLPDDRGVEALSEDLAGLQATLAAAIQERSTQAAAAQQVAALAVQARRTATRAALAQEARVRTAGSAESATAALRAARDRMRIASTRHSGCPCVQEVVTESTPDQARASADRHARWVTDLTQFVQAQDDLAAAVRRQHRAAEELTIALRSQQFDSAEAAQAAMLDDATGLALEELIRAHTQARAIVDATLADPEVSAALVAPPPDLPSLEAQAEAARSVLLTASALQSQAQRRADAVGRLTPDLLAALTALTPAAARAELVRALADTVTGIGASNDMRMRLTSFVLAARLEEVVHLANERLHVMGSGRYVLEHTDDLAPGGRRSGLGLRVLDQWTGRSRETSSLSGGETFMASLALALGLADAVRGAAGGAELATLFVDEGFGSLDDDSLEEVLDVLDRLREGGRAVGVVSHVADLRARITHRVVVDKTATGSTAQIQTPATGAA
ncbi:MAG: SMC family ATPase [Phycicoccus sp.]|nr:SMC family ATPase [Phycicoccus sp.]